MKSRRPLSSVPEEARFLAADEAQDAVCAPLKRLILARLAGQGAALHRPSLSLAVAYGAPSAIRLTMDARSSALAWSQALYPDETGGTVRKARRVQPGATEAELIDAALDAGIELGLETLPAKARREVDVAAARRVARSRLLQGSFRQNLRALEEAQRGLAVLVNASRNPSLAVLKDVERIASAFGLNVRQAVAIVRETQALVDAKKKTEAIQRAMTKRIRQALEARAEFLANELGSAAVNEAQRALYEQAQKDGLLDEDRHVNEWVTRHDEKVCPICDGLDAQRRPVGEAFESDYDGGEYDAPPAHPLCRCRLRLVTLRSPARGRRAA